ncbi:capsule assembly Wzi family protein [Labilibaculum manganireducens]|uniref:capsule assembly Wzi family protein n=1 Tax=Labilibaculum manganireducens TaxID=1940525 RepID=UPI0029F54CEA|nr:capsule assembly Wzi family protein [Labilibaculum manganireducens]
MYKKNLYLLILLFASGQTLFGQKKKVNYETEISAQVSSKSNLPFWMVTNKYGIVPDENSGIANFKIYSTPAKNIKGIDFNYGASLVGSRASESKFFIDELYVSAEWKKISINLGMQHRDVQFDGLSVTNNDLLYSGNARMYPELKFQLKEFISLPFSNNWLWVKGSFGNGIMYDDRYVNHTNVHHKNAFLRIGKQDGLSFTIGLDHYAQWGGTSPKWGNLGGFDAFADAVFVRGGKVLVDKNGNQSINESYNKSGNHIGQNMFEFSYSTSKIESVLSFKNMYEDKSGDFKHINKVKDWNMSFFLKFKESKLISSFIYEYYYTKDQGGYSIRPNHPIEPVIGFDGYFSNSIFQSGWTNHQRIIGLPLFTASINDGVVGGISNNAVVAHHFGITGVVGKFRYKTLLTFSENYGRALLVNDGQGNQEENYSKSYTYPNGLSQQSYLMEVIFPRWKAVPFEVSTSIAVDRGKYLDNNIGFQIKLVKTGILSGKKKLTNK